jgi:hypothetical protein
MMRNKLFLIMLMLLLVASVSALTQGDWSVSRVTSGSKTFNIFTCTVVTTTDDTVATTQKTPVGLDTSREWTLIANATAVTIDGTPTAPLNAWFGISADAAKTGDASDLETDVYEFKAIESDIIDSAGIVVMDPLLTTADVSNVRVLAPPMPYYVFEITGTGKLNAVSIVFYIIQARGR